MISYSELDYIRTYLRKHLYLKNRDYYKKMRQAYDTDLIDQEWEIIMPMLPKPSKLGRPAIVDMREVMNGIFYILNNGCTWQFLPHDLPPYSTVYFYFRRWTIIGLIGV